MRKWLVIIPIFVCVIGAPPGVRADSLQSLVDSNTAFGLNLYGQLAPTPGNLFFSPYSISTCLAMTYEGARGDTQTQMAQVLGFGTNDQQLGALFGALQSNLETNQETNAIELNIANALWTQEGYPFVPAFLQTATTEYQASVNQANFITGAAEATKTINSWVAQKTQDKIQDILPAGALNADTRLVLANAIYFKGMWATTFEITNTSTQSFYLSATSQVDVPLMHQSAEPVGYMATAQFQAVELPYASNQLSMVILLPSQVDGCAQLERQLSPAFLSGVLAQMLWTKADIFLPRFTLESSFDLDSPLSEMGMPDAFTMDVADFSGIDGMRDLLIGHVFHKAWGEVNEEGTEAAAATVVGVTSFVGAPTTPPIFRADHPFIFFIRDTQSGSLLFLGRLADPGPSGGATQTLTPRPLFPRPRSPSSAR